MKFTRQLAKHLRDVYSGGNWTTSNFRENLKNVDWKQATLKPGNLNSIASLTYHSGYYLNALIQVLEGKTLNTKDEQSFNHPPINSEEDWQQLVTETLNHAEKAAALLEQLPDGQLWENFQDEKYGNYLRNILGVTEHSHYHLGQIALIRKMLVTGNAE